MVDDTLRAPVSVRIDPDVEFKTMEVAGVNVIRCAHRGTGVHFQFGTAEHHVATLLDGNRSVSEVARQSVLDGLDWSPQDVADFVGVLVAQKIAIVGGPRSAPRDPQPRRCEPMWKTLLTRSTKWCGLVISVRFPVLHADQWAERLIPWVRFLLSRTGWKITSGVIAISIGFAAYHHAGLIDELIRVFDSNQWVLMLIAWTILKVIHESGHACVARSQGVRVGRAGVMFFLFAPMAYVDVTDAWKLPRRHQRISIALGGVYFELVCASIAVWVWWLCPGGVVAHVAAQVFFVAGPASLLVNANPLLRLDGYYVIADLVDIPNLREQGRRLLGGAIERRLFAIEPPDSFLQGWRRAFAISHAAASVTFQFVWMGGLIIVVSMWAGPIGLLVAACALVLWTLLPAARWLLRIWNYNSGGAFSSLAHRRRVLWMALTLITIAQFFVTLPSPIVVEVPVIARFAGDHVLRSPASGFVRHVYLTSGQSVRSGEVVLEIGNDELLIERDELELEIQSEAIRWQRNESQRSLGLAEAATQRSESLKRNLSELNEQVSAMHVRASRDGEVLTPELSRLVGRFVVPGQELVQIGNRADKELLLTIGEEELDAYQNATEHGEPLRVCFRGGQCIEVVAQPTRPRASVAIPHLALAATAGGPLTVAPVSRTSSNEAQMELVSPRFEAIVPLSPGQGDAVRSGEVGMLALQDRRSLARRFWEWMKRVPQQ